MCYHGFRDQSENLSEPSRRLLGRGDVLYTLPMMAARLACGAYKLEAVQ
jgi:hypothetical protein